MMTLILTIYLTGRSFTVRVGQSTSPSRPMTTGAPQGSVLIPTIAYNQSEAPERNLVVHYIKNVSPTGRLIASHGVECHQ